MEVKTQGDLNLLRLIENRIGEIVQIEDEIKKKQPKLFHQRLPRFMRRRAASHTPGRIPKKLRPLKLCRKGRKKLYRFRVKIRYQKHKRILKKKRLHKYKDQNKSLLHKWFAKRFKMLRDDESGSNEQFVPFKNNTKNQRNLYRQTRFGCAYLSMIQLIGCKIDLNYSRATVDRLNKLTMSISGFTFSARCMESSRYEVAVHLFRQEKEDCPHKREYLCPVHVLNFKSYFELWLPRSKLMDLSEELRLMEIPFSTVMPRDSTRIRLVGPNARSEVMKIVEEGDGGQLNQAIDDVDKRLLPSQAFGISLGRVIQTNNNTTVIYYQTKPLSVDIIFRDKPGRLLWYKLIKNKAHLVGGLRDVQRLLTGKDFELHPDYTET